MALPAIEPAVEPTAEPMTLDQNPPPLDVAELLTVWLMTVVFFFTTVVRFGTDLTADGREKERPPKPRPPRASAAVEMKNAATTAAKRIFFIFYG